MRRTAPRHGCVRSGHACALPEKGESVSYGWTYTADHDLTVAVVGVGYADNYSRSLSNTGYMNIKGHRAPILGRICMQMTMVDVTGIMGEGLDVRPGDRAWLLGGPGPGTITPEDLAMVGDHHV